MSHPCPRCGGRYTQRLAIVYSAGTSTWTDYRGRPRTSQNMLSSMASPPRRRRTFIRYLALFIFLAWTSFLLYAAFSPPSRPASGYGQHLSPTTSNPGHHTSRPQPAEPLSATPAYEAPRPRTPIEPLNHYLAQVIFFSIHGVVIAILTLSIVRANRYNRTVWPSAMQHWNASFMCRGCGCVFIP